MADKTTGELTVVNVSDLPAAADIYDDFKMPGELQGSSVHVTGAQMKQYAVNTVKPLADAAGADAATAKNAAASAEGAKTAAQSALSGVQAALDNLPAGDTLVINDLTTGGKSAALSAEMGKVLGQRPNPNLLHNWYFANCVNQRGQTEYSGTGYTADRWSIRKSSGTDEFSCTTAIRDGGVTVTNSSASGTAFFTQFFEDTLPAGTYTLSVLVTEVTGSVYMALYTTSGTYNRRVAVTEPGIFSLTGAVAAGEQKSFRILVSSGASVTIAAVKLERGGTQTLAHQDSGGNWVLNEIPDYGEELAKCQRYQVDIGGYYPVAVNSAAMSYTFIIQLPKDMRSTPNVDLSNASLTTTNVTVSTDGTFSVIDCRGRSLRVRFVPSSPPAALGDAVLDLPIGTIADANL